MNVVVENLVVGVDHTVAVLVHIHAFERIACGVVGLLVHIEAVGALSHFMLLHVGYTWDSLMRNRLRLRLYGAVQNPFVITSYKGLGRPIPPCR